jgi:hypothetical protein
MEALAKETGVDAGTARDLLTHTLGRIDKIRNQVNKK